MDVLQFFIIHTVGTGTNNKSCNIRKTEGMFIQHLQLLKRCVCIAVGLKIYQELLRSPVTDSMKVYSLRDLSMKVLGRIAIGRIKGIVVAVGATPDAFRSVAVWACKSGVHNHFLYTASEDAPDVFRI